MSVPTHVLYIARKPHEVNGCLAAQEGRVLLIVPNYTEVFAEPPKVTDGQTQVFAVEVKNDEVVQQEDGGVQRLLLWIGDANARSRPQDKLTLPVASLLPLGESVAESAVDTARVAFADLAEPVKLAAIIASVSNDTLIALPEVGPSIAATLRAWAEETLAKAVK